MPMTRLDQMNQTSDKNKSMCIRISVTPEKADKRGSEWELIRYPEHVKIIAFEKFVDIIVHGRSERNNTPNFGRVQVAKRDIPMLFLEMVRAMINYVPETYEQWPDEDENAEEKQEWEKQESEWIKKELQQKGSELSVLADALISVRDEIVRSQATDR